MKKFQVITDSTSDLEKKFRDEYDIEYLKMVFTIDNKDYDADLDWTSKNSRSTIESDKNELKLSFEEIKNICGFEINHSFLNSKKELENLGYEVAKISLKEKYILFKKIN